MMSIFNNDMYSMGGYLWIRRFHYGAVTTVLTLTLLGMGACTSKPSPQDRQTVSASAAPLELTAGELDRVSAAGVAVDVDVLAMVKGQFGQADTDVMTGVVAVGPQVIGYGFGSGEAVVCCGEDSELVLETTASGVGDYVFADTHTVYAGDGTTKYGLTQGVVLALSGPSRAELIAATADYINAVRQAPPSTYLPSVANPTSQAAR